MICLAEMTHAPAVISHQSRARVSVHVSFPTDNVRSFSAVCWFFGKQLYETLGYPIGLIQSAFGGTQIERWSSAEALDVCFGDDPPA